jgi:LacI family transcriptional regulator
MKHPTIDDIAQITGFSKSTVSRALNNSSVISQKTREIIAETAKQIHYEPNLIARSLTKSRTFTIGVILEDFANPFFTEVAKGIESVLKQSGYTMLVTSSEYQEHHERIQVRTFIQNKVDGILITPINADSETIELLKHRNIPFVIMNARTSDTDTAWVDNDNFTGEYIATQFLLKQGHKNIIYLRSMRLEGNRQRYAGFKKAIEEFGYSVDDQIILGESLTREDGYRLLDEYFKAARNGIKPTAVKAQNDDSALGAMERILEEGIQIPETLSIMGYDDIDISGLVRVPLTTIHQRKFTMGKFAAETLLSIIDTPPDDTDSKVENKQTILEPRLVIRQSCMEPRNEQ